MTPTNERPRRVLVLMSDTGGGHRAAAEAIQAAAAIRYPGELDFTMIDVFRRYTPFPFKYAPEIYPAWVNYGAFLWQLSYLLSNARRRSQFAVNSFYFQWRDGVQQMLAEHQADLILCVHSIITRPVMKGLQELPQRPPFITVVTDLVSTHAFWYEKKVDRCLVPTQRAYERGLHFGLTEEQLRITGLPVHPRFVDGLMDKAAARATLGLDADLPAVLLISGGEGMGPLFRIAEAINRKRLPCQLLIVAGRNSRLQARLEAHDWHQPTTIYGYVDFMPRLMAAADMIVTKAGPATITEACVAGLPLIISGAIPGQEEGNVEFVVRNDIGVYAPRPGQVAETLAQWLREDPARLRERAARARERARPDAVWKIVDEVHHYAHLAPVKNPSLPLPYTPSPSHTLSAADDGA